MNWLKKALVTRYIDLHRADQTRLHEKFLLLITAYWLNIVVFYY
ncbi:hypothetical protein OMCYN_01703 [cyanobiont of Ornithocercus magnificus]|nr:hypothetical protein OMCYN_01703 [cyanobiont of Ornithocercus magnificus]